MIRRRYSSNGRAGGGRGAPNPDAAPGWPAAGEVPETARPARWGQKVRDVPARIGAPSLIALATSIGLTVLVVCGLYAPGFVLRAQAETTVPIAPASAKSVTTQPTTIDPAPTQLRPAEATTPTSVLSPPAAGDPASQWAARVGGKVFATLQWGSGPGQVGIVQPTEGLTRGPEALAVGPDGRVAVLDGVNSRVVVLGADGVVTSAIPVPLVQPRFLALAENGFYVLDADEDHELMYFDWQGSLQSDARIPSLDDVVTGLFVTAAGPSIEVAHADTFLVAFKDKDEKQASGPAVAAGRHPAAAALRAVTGRPVGRDLGQTAKATFKAGQGIRLNRFKIDKESLRATQTGAEGAAFAHGAKLEHLVSLDGDGQGGLIVGARLLPNSGDPPGTPSLVIGRVAGSTPQSEADKALTAELTLCDSSFAYLGEPYTVAPDGRIFQPIGSDGGYTIWVYSLPGTSTVDTPEATEVQP